MKNIVKIILGVAVVGAIAGGCFMFFNTNGNSNISGGQKVILTNKDKSVTLDLPKVDQLEDSQVSVMGMLWDNKKIKEISLNLKNCVSVRYQLADVVYNRDTLQSISNSEDKNAVKEVKIGKDNFMYIGTKQEVKNQDPYYYYYIISIELLPLTQ